MFHLTVTSADINFRYFIFGGSANQESIRSAGELFGPQGAKYIIGVAGKGYVTITDVGNTVHGVGDWAVQATGSTDYWFYNGEGQGSVTFNGETFTIGGGANTIQGKLSVGIQYSLGLITVSGLFPADLDCILMRQLPSRERN